MRARSRLGKPEGPATANVVILALVAIGALCGAVDAAAQEEIAATFREAIAVELASVDVVVEDRDGKPVPGLAREDFTVLVDGRPVELTHFVAYRFDGAPARASGQPAASTKESAAAPSASAAEVPPPATWVVYVDFSKLRHFSRVEAVRQTRRFLERSVRHGEKVMVVAFDTRSLRVHQGLGDVAAASRALETLEGRVVIPGRPVPVDADPSERAMSEQEEELALRYQLGAFRDLFSLVDVLEGRVALLLVGGGIDTSAIAEDRRTTYLRDYGRLLERANTGRMTVYTIYAGPDRFPDVGADIDSPGSTPETSSTLSAFAKQTGGLAFVGAPDLATQLERARSDLDAYYSLGYRPPDGSSASVQRLEVKVRGDRLRVRHRTALRGRSQQQRAEGQTLAALLTSEGSASPDANPLGIAATVGEAGEPRLAGARRVPVVVRVPIGPLTLVAQGGRHLGRLAFHFVVEGPDGGYRGLEARELPLAIPSAELATARAQSVEYALEFELPKGSHRLAVTVSDMVGGVHATVTVPIEVGKSRTRARR